MPSKPICEPSRKVHITGETHLVYEASDGFVVTKCGLRASGATITIETIQDLDLCVKCLRTIRRPGNTKSPKHRTPLAGIRVWGSQQGRRC